MFVIGLNVTSSHLACSVIRWIVSAGRSAYTSGTNLQHIWSTHAHGRRPSYQQPNSAGITRRTNYGILHVVDLEHKWCRSVEKQCRCPTFCECSLSKPSFRTFNVNLLKTNACLQCKNLICVCWFYLTWSIEDRLNIGDNMSIDSSMGPKTK